MLNTIVKVGRQIFEIIERGEKSRSRKDESLNWISLTKDETNQGTNYKCLNATLKIRYIENRGHGA